MKDVIDKMYELPLFPGMVVKESLSATKQAVNEVDKKIMEFITNIIAFGPFNTGFGNNSVFS